MLRFTFIRILALAVMLAVVAGACSSGDTAQEVGAPSTTADSTSSTAADQPVDTTEPVESSEVSSFTAEVWADNWFALSINGVLVGEDSLPITTERSFNAETISFEAEYPLTIAIEAKDFKETDSGLEYIGDANQQMGDGGIIAQITDEATGEVIAVTNSDWSVLVVHRAPLNVECEKDTNPDDTCEFEILETPIDWVGSAFDDSGWVAATEWTESDVGPKDGYNEVSWDNAARLVWGTDLEVDNTILLRIEIAG